MSNETFDFSDENESPEPKAKKTSKWWFISPVLTLWGFGGVQLFLLRDIPLLLFLVPLVFLIEYPMARWGDRKGAPWRITLWILFLTAAVYALVMYVIPPFSISRETTYLTEPRATERFGIDYLKAIEERSAPKVASEDNGFRLLLEKLGRPFVHFDDEHWTILCEKLDLPLEIEPVATFTDWYKFTKSLPEEEQNRVKDIFSLPPPRYSAEARAVVRRWLDENGAAIELFVQALDKPVFYAPPIGTTDLLSARLILEDRSREMARSLQIRLLYHLSEGDADAAWADLRLLYRLEQLHRPHVWNLLTMMTGNAVFGVADSSSLALLRHGKLTPEQIRELRRELDEYQVPNSDEEIRRMMLGERFTVLDAIQRFADGVFSVDDDAEPPGEFKRRQFRFVRFGPVMQSYNRYFDDIDRRGVVAIRERMAKRENKRGFNIPDFLGQFAWYGQVRVIPKLIGEIMMDLMVHDHYTGSCDTRKANIALNRLAFALELYRLDSVQHGEQNYPESLETLVPKYLEEIPVDPFAADGTAIHYRLENGRCIFYSIGPDGVDQQDAEKSDDIRRRLPPE